MSFTESIFLLLIFSLAGVRNPWDFTSMDGHGADDADLFKKAYDQIAAGLQRRRSCWMVKGHNLFVVFFMGSL
jgi:hypothetical protein